MFYIITDSIRFLYRKKARKLESYLYTSGKFTRRKKAMSGIWQLSFTTEEDIDYR